jgi:hypothetical protein
MYAVINSTSGSITDETDPVYVNYSNPGGGGADVRVFLRPLGSSGGFTTIATRLGYSSGANINLTTTERNLIRSTLSNAKQGQIIYRITTAVGETDYGWSNEAILTITNANPLFTTATYKDANSSTVAVTGNDQYLIQGYSTLEVGIASGDKAVAQKSATMTKYNMAIGSINVAETYTTSTIAKNLGILGINADANLTIKAIDSRTNFTNVVLPVNVLPYIAPQITATAQRVNNFETETDFHIEAVISRLTIAGTDKNTVNTSNGVRYRYKKTTDVSWGSWVNKASTTTAGNVAVTDFSLVTQLDRNYAWNIQIEVTDKLSTSTLDLLLSVGIPVFRIGLDSKVYNNEKTLYPCPFKVGDILISTSSANPSATFEGTTWVAWGAGRVPVGFNSGDASFDTVEETGGAKTHTLTTSEIPSHSHSLTVLATNTGGGGNVSVGNNPPINSGSTGSTGGGGSHNNLQPYIVAYMWKRTV